jgi:tRNA threonylcarbamoyladenosine biosynthesis protein TsaB
MLVPWPDTADLATWEPNYGRLAEAQVKWEAAHGRALTAG